VSTSHLHEAEVPQTDILFCMGISFEGKSDEELFQIAADPNCPSEVLMALYKFSTIRPPRPKRNPPHLGNRDISLPRRRDDPHLEALTAYFEKESARFYNFRQPLWQRIALNPNIYPDLIKDIFIHAKEEILQNPSLPLLLIENPNLFDDLNHNYLSRIMHMENIPYCVLSALNSHPSTDIAHAAHCHVGYAGEVQNNEDYTESVRGIMHLRLEATHKDKLCEGQIFPRCLSDLEKNKVWSPEEVIQEGIRCHMAFQSQVAPIHIQESLHQGRYYREHDMVDNFLIQFLEISKDELQDRWIENHPFIMAMVRLYYSEFEYDESYSCTTNGPEKGFFHVLNPNLPIPYLEELAIHVNRYVRVTAQAALEMRRG
jgi:hypothetical protein